MCMFLYVYSNDNVMAIVSCNVYEWYYINDRMKKWKLYAIEW